MHDDRARQQPRRDRTANERAADHAAIDRLADELLPALVAKLSATGLGEIEVREGQWRVRIRRPAERRRLTQLGRRSTDRPSRAQPGHAGHGHAPAALRGPPLRTRGTGGATDRIPLDERLDATAHRGRTGPGSGGLGRRRDVTWRGPPQQPPGCDVAGGRASTSPKADATPGTRVRAGDRLGAVDMLGVAQEVVAPADGLVGAEPRRAGPGGRVRPGARRDRARRANGRPGRGLTVFRKILIANRGEIALRILRACRTLGIEAVVAYSEADRDSLPVQLADEAICIGPADAKRSYLSAPAMISAAIVTGCDAIHPGYGFLSEDEGFAEVVRAHDLTFIGPPASRARAVRVEGVDPAAAGVARPADDPGLERHPSRRRPCPRRGRADRLPAADQAGGRWRRQGHADGPDAA